jgi:DNA polymerase-3 subunit gamma/tau
VLQRVERHERRIAVGGEASPESTKPVAERAEPAKQAPAEPAKSARAESAKPAKPVKAPPPAKASPPPPEPAEPKSAEVAPRAKPATVEPVPEPVPEAPASKPGALDAAAVRRIWPEVLEAVKGASRRTKALLDNAQVTGVVGEVVKLSAPGALAKMIAEESNISVLRSALTKVVGGDWKVAVETGANGSSDAPETSAEPTAAEADPRDEPDYQPAPAPATTPADSEAEAVRLIQEQFDARPLDS